MKYKIFNTTDEQSLLLESGDTIRTEVIVDSGKLSIKIQKDSDTPIYERDDIVTSENFDVEIQESGTYKITVIGENTKGGVNFKKVDGEKAEQEETQQGISEKKIDLGGAFQEINGCAVIYSPVQEEYSFFNEDMCRQEVSPYSTFKIISALLGLQKGVIVDKSSTMGYDGTDYGNAEWNGDLTLEEAIETTKIHSISANLTKEGLILSRPFRMPHHTAPIKSIIGGGKLPMPGEISLAHNGILFLDELTEYNRVVLEALREPLEEKEITINRLSGNYRYPCNFMFVASMNPCPCGYYGDEEKECKCTQLEIHRYLNRISGPLLDRIDIQIEVKKTKIEKMNSNFKAESSKRIKQRVNIARKIQNERYKSFGIKSNSELTTRLIGEFCNMNDDANMLLQRAFKMLKLSVRGYERILKVARTIADLDNEKIINAKHIAEAVQYRSIDKFLNK